MKLTTWNCRIGGFRTKAKHIASHRPDVLVVQEVEPSALTDLFLDGDSQPTYRDRVGDPAMPKRAIGVFSYTSLKLDAVDVAEPAYCFRRHSAQQGDLAFQVVSVWQCATDDARATWYQQAHDGLRRHAEWIRQRPTVILGDFNDNGHVSYGKTWRALLDQMNGLDLVSTYHHFFHEDFGSETRPTHFHQGKEQKKFHVDYCFVPRAWTKHITKVDVGTFADWGSVSDHAPLTVELAL